MANIHDDFADLAVELVTDNGRPITIQRKTIVPDTTSPEKVGTSSIKPYKTFGAFVQAETENINVALLQSIGASEGMRSAVVGDGTICLIPAQGLPITIEAKDTILDGTSTVWEIKNVELIKPGTLPILFICELRK